MVRVCLPFMDLWSEMEGYTGGDGDLDKLCMELVGPAVQPQSSANARRAGALPRQDASDAA